MFFFWKRNRDRSALLGCLTVACFICGCFLLPAGPLLLFQQTRVALTPAISLAEIAAMTGGDQRGPYRIAGRIAGDDLPSMPGDSGGEVLAGRRVITVRATRSGAGEDAEVMVQELLNWEGYAGRLTLTEGAATVAIDIAARELPLRSDPGPRADLVTEQEGSVRRPLRVNYDGMTLPVDPDQFPDIRSGDSLTARIERALLRPGEEVTIVADIAPAPGGGRIVAPAAGGLMINRGSIGENMRFATSAAFCTPVLGVVLLVVGVVLFVARRLGRFGF
jgi:hypothetical protein